MNEHFQRIILLLISCSIFHCQSQRMILVWLHTAPPKEPVLLSLSLHQLLYFVISSFPSIFDPITKLGFFFPHPSLHGLHLNAHFVLPLIGQQIEMPTLFSPRHMLPDFQTTFGSNFQVLQYFVVAYSANADCTTEDTLRRLNRFLDII